MNAAVPKASEIPYWIPIIIIVLILIFTVPAIMRASSSTSNPTNIATTKQQQVAIFQTKFVPEYKDKKSLIQAVREQAITDQENCLINFQPLTVIHPGFLGPVKDGVYDEKEGVTTALRLGSRCFVLPIDYHEKDTMGDAFPPANTPCLLYRDSSDTVRSIEGGSIAKVAQAIADIAWSDLVSQKNDPFILILFFIRTPEEGTKEYLTFLSKVARDLSPLSPYLLGQTPEGVYNRQARQDEILFVPVSSLEKKLLIFCNVDTSGFRTSATTIRHTFLPREDLDYWVHLRLYKQNEETSIGATSTPERSGIPRGLLETQSYFTSLPTDAKMKKKTIQTTKEQFTVSFPPAGTNPDTSTLVTLLDTYGVQAVPLLLTEYTPEMKILLSQWKYAWRAKPKALRYSRPAPQPLVQQSRAVDANGGMITPPK